VPMTLPQSWTMSSPGGQSSRPLASSRHNYFLEKSAIHSQPSVSTRASHGHGDHQRMRPKERDLPLRVMRGESSRQTLALAPPFCGDPGKMLRRGQAYLRRVRNRTAKRRLTRRASPVIHP
jgi:hypothetical protein